VHIDPVDPSPQLADQVERMIDTLPAWFGQPDSNAEYVAAGHLLPGLIATFNDRVAGVLLYRRRFPETAEIHFLGVAPDVHRRGIGRALIDHLERLLVFDGCRLLEVKTLGESFEDDGYARTRAFYQGSGFLRIEETPDLWDGTPCLILVKVLSAAAITDLPSVDEQSGD
jgi:ribosomal protein S18 acetylase RimI-like enzyme